MPVTAPLNLPPLVPFRQDAALIGLVSAGHLISHFSQLLLAPLFPWLKDAFSVSYTELGLIMTVFFVVSCIVQALSGFVVDRSGPRPVLFGGLFLLGVAALGYAGSTSYGMLIGFAVLAGMGNGVFHPVNYTLLNRKVSGPRLGHAYSVHGITGNLGWAIAPALLVPVAFAFSWRVALVCAAVLIFTVLAVLLVNASRLTLPGGAASAAADKSVSDTADGSFGFLRIPAVWMCLFFFLLYAIVLSVVQTFAPQAARQLNGLEVVWVASCLSVYMLCSAGGMVIGGFLAADAARCERVVAAGFSMAAAVALTLALAPLTGWVMVALFGLMGFASGAGGPSRDLIVKRATPANASGRVYGVVYSGLDIGQALAPLVFGALMDGQRFQAVLIGLALVQGVLIATAFNVKRARRGVPPSASSTNGELASIKAP